MTTSTLDAERPADKDKDKDKDKEAGTAADKTATIQTPVLDQPVSPRLRWRVVVRTGAAGKMDPSRPSRPLAWHLASCTASEDPEAHCPEGQRLLATGDDPDGHCLLDGVCPRCEMQK